MRVYCSQLEGVSQKQRTPKINMALASLYHRQGMERYTCSFGAILAVGFPVVMYDQQ